MAVDVKTNDWCQLIYPSQREDEESVVKKI